MLELNSEFEHFILIQGGRMKKIIYGLRHHFLLLGIITCLGSVALATPDDVLVFLQADASFSIDPVYYDFTDSMVVDNLYEGLLTIDNDGNPVPVLATSWETSEDGLTYTFTLREEVKFHTGATFTCQDAEYSYRLRLLTGNASIISPFLLGFESWEDDEDTISTTPFSAITDVIYCDEENRLTIKLLYPRYDALVLIGNVGVVFDHFYYTENGGWSGTEEDWQTWINIENKPVSSPLENKSAGTGAYQLSGHESVTRTTAKMFPDYWGEKASIETVFVQYIPDANTQVLALKNGDADALVSLSANYIPQLEGTSDIVIGDRPTSFIDYFILNQNLTSENPEDETWQFDTGSGKLDGQGIPHDFFSDPHVRQGFTHAFDAQRIIDTVFDGRGTLSSSIPVATSVLGANAITPESAYSLEQATEAFKLAWDGQVWEQGFVITLGYSADANNQFSSNIAEVLKQSVESINPKFRVNIKEYTGDEGYGEMFYKTPLLLDYWLVFPTTNVSLRKMVLGYGDISIGDEKANELVDLLEQEADPETYNALLTEIQNYWAENNFLIMVPERVAGAAYRSNLQGEGLTVYPTREVKYIWKDITKTPAN
jgi:peptide/nickel transport system substrate-binding protein